MSSQLVFIDKYDRQLPATPVEYQDKPNGDHVVKAEVQGLGTMELLTAELFVVEADAKA